MTTEALIVDAVRTARARRKGKFLGIHPVDLATYPMNALKERSHFDPSTIEDVILGCVTQAGEQAWCVARKVVLAAGWPVTVPATTVNRLCASGQQAVHNGASGVLAGQYDLVVAGGLEHMTRAPMFSDGGGEESPLLMRLHPDLVPQGLAAELICEKYKLQRKELDEYSVRSHKLAAQAQREGRFSKGLLPVTYTDEQGKSAVLAQDDSVRPDTSAAALAGLKPAFKEDGVITAGNASGIVDGAAALLLASRAGASALGVQPRARIVSMAQVGSDPRLMLTGPAPAAKLALKRAGLSTGDIDVWEINEAFAPVVLVACRELEIDVEKVNVNGGGISLGHPLGATGAMLIGTALDELERTGKQFGLITMCIGLGMGVATIIERI